MYISPINSRLSQLIITATQPVYHTTTTDPHLIQIHLTNYFTMKTTSILATLAIALPAFATYAPAAPCPGSDGGVFSSGNSIEYTISCAKNMSGDVIRTSDTSVGMEGCLAACDGTVGCTSVVYWPSDDDGTKGVCESHKSGGTASSVNYESAALAVRLTPEPSTTITTWPTATATTTY